jgi:tRNA(fMet)-specific endonuclease VapC
VLLHVANDVPGAARISERIAAARLGELLLSAVTAYELRFMIVRPKASKERVAALAALMRQFPVERFDLPAAHAAADVRAECEARGRPLGPYDTLLAGHARRLGAALVTDDEGFGEVAGLRIENWLR